MRTFEVTAYSKGIDASVSYRVQADNANDAYNTAYDQALDNGVHLDTMEIDIEELLQ